MLNNIKGNANRNYLAYKNVSTCNVTERTMAFNYFLVLLLERIH